MMIAVSLPKPFFTNWTLSNSLKPALLLGVASASSVAVVTSISKSPAEAEKILREVANKVIEPFSPFTKQLSEGTLILFNTLGSWSKWGSNTSKVIAKQIPKVVINGNVPEGTKKLFSTLSTWSQSIFSMVKSFAPTLMKKETYTTIKDFVKSTAPLVKNILNIFSQLFNANLNGNTPLISTLFKAMEKSGFGDFMSALGNLATTQQQVFSQMTTQDMGDLFNAFSVNQKGTTQFLENFTKLPKEKANKNDLMNSLKPASLAGRIQDAIDRAQVYLVKGKLTTKEEKSGAIAAQEELKRLYAALSEAIQKVTQQVK